MRHTIAKSIERGLNGGGGSLGADRVAAAVRCAQLDPAGVEGLRRLLYWLTWKNPSKSSLLASPQEVRALAFLAAHRDRWVRPVNLVNLVDPGPCAGHRARLHAVASHLLCRYPVPVSFVDAWLDDDLWARRGRQWFIHVGDGLSLRRAPDLPFPLTRRMAHLVPLAPPHLGMLQALRWGQLTALGVPRGLAVAAAAGPLGRWWPDETFCLRVARFLAAHPDLSPGRVTPVLDFLYARRFGGHGLTAAPHYDPAAKALATVEREMLAWHGELGRAEPTAGAAWESCGIRGMAPYLGPGGRTWRIVELTDAEALRAEGADMRHCVFSYAARAAGGACAIFSLRTRGEGGAAGAIPRVTIEVQLPDRRVVQARARANSRPTAEAWSAIRRWVEAEGLSVTPGVR